ncbi:MAG: GAF domain-containing protein [Erysipelotrichia bacterium]|nr:GAF domain-containing protein [Erysipelotrichia bacterium]
MKTAFLDVLTELEGTSPYSELADKNLDLLCRFKDYLGIGLRFYTGEAETWRQFKLHKAHNLDIAGLCDFSKNELPDSPANILQQSLNGKNYSVIISPYFVGTSHLADLILILTQDTDYSLEEWHLFADCMAERICAKFLFPLHLISSHLENSERLLLFMRETQTLLNTNRYVEALAPGFEKRQAELWFNDDSPILTAFLTKLQREFNLYAVFLVQQAAPGFCNQITVAAINDTEDPDASIQEMIDTAMQHDLQKEQEQAIISKSLLKTGKSEFRHEAPIPLLFSCMAGGVTYGHLGLSLPSRHVYRHIGHRAKLLPMLANQLGLYFSHFYQLRKEALQIRMLQQINQTCNLINASVNIGAILFKLVESLNYLFGQYSGAILMFEKETSELEVVNYLGGEIPKDFDLHSIINTPGPLLDAISEGSAFDNRDGRHDLPIRYILPLATNPNALDINSNQPSRSLGCVVLFDSKLNQYLSEDTLHTLLTILLSGISAALQSACNYEEKLDTIRALEGMMGKLSDTDKLLDEMISIIRRLLNVNRISYLELDETGKYLHIKKSYGLPAGIMEKTKIPIGEEISGHVAKEGHSYRIDNIESEGVFKKRSLEDYLNRSLLSVPLIRNRETRDSKVIGVINVNNKNNGMTFTFQDQELLEAIAHLVVTAIENVRLLEEESEKKLFERQLNDARDIQMSLMPKTFVDMPASIDIFGKSIPARQIGGDFFDILSLDDGRLLIVLGDVSGKGMPAAILMAVTRMIIRGVVQNNSDLVSIIETVNDRLTRELDSYHFVTLQLVAIDPRTGDCEMSSAGHGPLTVYLQGALQQIETRSGPPLGMAGIVGVYHKSSFLMTAGDTLIMYTDGLSEERSPAGEMFGTDRINSLMEKHSDSTTARDLTETLIATVENWRDAAEAHDDLTVLSLKFKGISA